MARVVLHIGTHKTASTTIQDTFAANAALLARHRLIYPVLGAVSGHHGFVCDWISLNPVYQLPGGSGEALRKLTRKYATTESTVFLSSEEFSRCGEGDVDLAEIRDILSDFETIEVICVLREQWQFLQSVYLELSKKQQPPGAPHIVSKSIETGVIGGLFVDYNLLIDRLERVFLPEEITLLDYNRSKTSEGGIISILLRVLGIEIAQDEMKLVNGGQSNVSPMPLASWLANVLAQPKVAPPWLVHRCASLIKSSHGEDIATCVFSRPEFDMLRAHFDPLNEKLTRRRQPLQPDFRITSSAPLEPAVFRGGLEAGFWPKAARHFVQDRL
ncbi:hypothetical protein [Rhodosalinus sp. 5P4]|uniref:hypothetical protein n=1 Tax=Rhodosalinus sp. 5P4 TaxID=3239196 RepID=UPI00352386D5